MKKILFLLTFFCLQLAANGQERTVLSDLQKQLKNSRPDSGRISILLKMAEFEILKPGEFKNDLDSAAGYINQAEEINKSTRSSALTGYINIEKSFLAREHKDMVSGKILMETAIKQLADTHNKNLLGKAYLGLSNYYDYLNPNERPVRIKYLQQAADLYKIGGDVEHEADCDKFLAELEPTDVLSFQKLTEAMKLYQSINYKQMQAIYDLCAQQYFETDLKKSLQYGLKAYTTAREQNDHSGTMVEIENDLAGIYNRIKDYPNEFKYRKMAFDNAKLNGDINSAVYIAVTAAGNYRYIGQPQQAQKTLASISAADLAKAVPDYKYLYYLNGVFIYLSLKEFGLAEQASTNLIHLLNTQPLPYSHKITGYRVLASYYLDTKQIAKAKYYINLDKDALTNPNASVEEKRGYQPLLFRLDTAMHDYKAAVANLQIIDKRKDSLNNVALLEGARRLQTQYETKQKENQISFYKQTVAFKDRNLRQANIVKNYTVGGIILLLIIAILLYRQNLLKQRSSKIISDKNLALQQLLIDKEWLLKEVHHRVKNNLHTVICLLDSQALYLKDDALKAIENSKHRIYAMSLIHQKLYQSDDIKVIDMDKYLSEFLHYLEESFGSPAYIKMNFKTQPFQLAAAQAIPVGLIINEAVTNAYKYAFPKQKLGEIRVILNLNKEEVFLSVSDNGIGFQQTSDNEVSSLGMELIKGLALDLRGELIFKIEMGTTLELRFKIDRYTMHVEEESGYLANAV